MTDQAPNLTTICHAGQPWPDVTAFARVEDQLVALGKRYQELEDLYFQASDEEEARGLVSSDHGSPACHFLRQQNGVVVLMNGMRAATVRELGLKARIVAHLVADWWDDPAAAELDRGELACRALLEDILSAAGVTRIPVRDFSPAELRGAA